MADTTTVRVSRRTHEILTELAGSEGRTVTAVLEQLAEQARRRRILEASATRVESLMADPIERDAYRAELRLSESTAADAVGA